MEWQEQTQERQRGLIKQMETWGLDGKKRQRKWDKRKKKRKKLEAGDRNDFEKYN